MTTNRVTQTPVPPKLACASACANIALIKYWGKSNAGKNRPAVPSLSLTLDALRTLTRVEFLSDLEMDEVTLDGVALDSGAGGRARTRVVNLLDRVRERAGIALHARVKSHNAFPTAAGLASSASGFAALALAASVAAGLEPSRADLSALARQSSASAARSLFGGYAVLEADAESAEALAEADHFPLSMLIALTRTGPKAVGSTEGMQHTARTSPFYPAWLEHAPILYREAKRAVLAKDFATLGACMEQSTLMMHSTMFAARPQLIYWAPASLRAIESVTALRKDGIPAYFTMDAGPHVKVLTLPEHAERVAQELERTEGVLSVLRSGPGHAARLIESAEFDDALGRAANEKTQTMGDR